MSMNNQPLPPGPTGDVFALLRVIGDKDAAEARAKELGTLNDQIAASLAEQRTALAQVQTDRAAADKALADATAIQDLNEQRSATFDEHVDKTEAALQVRETALEAREKEFDKQAEELESELDTREKAVTDREAAVTLRESTIAVAEREAEAMRDEYAAKIDKLKAITGATDAGS